MSIPQPLSPSTQKLNARPQKEQIGQQLQLLLEWLYLITLALIFSTILPFHVLSTPISLRVFCKINLCIGA